MEPVITPTLLASTGIDIPDSQVAPLLDYLNELLEERIGEAIVDELEIQQLEELAALQETATDEQVHEWIQAHVSNLDEIIQDEVSILLGDAVEHRDKFSAQ